MLLERVKLLVDELQQMEGVLHILFQVLISGSLALGALPGMGLHINALELLVYRHKQELNKSFKHAFILALVSTLCQNLSDF